MYIAMKRQEQLAGLYGESEGPEYVGEEQAFYGFVCQVLSVHFRRSP
jgi:hypothetical protein